MMLRDVVEEDLDAFFEHQRDPQATAMATFPSRERDPFLLHWWDVLGNDTVFKQTIVDGHDVCGYVASWSQDERRLVAYWLGSAFWRRGLATASVGEFLARHEKTRPLHAFVAVSNAASRRVLHKCGFVPASEPTKGNDGVDEILMALR